MLKVFYALINHHMLISILAFPSSEYSGISAAFSNLLITLTSS